MNRVIHGAFRRDLLRFDQALAAFPEGSAERAEQLGAEDLLVGDLHGEHATMLVAVDNATAAMRQLVANPTAAKKVHQAHKGNTGMFIAWLNDGIEPTAKAFLSTRSPGRCSLLRDTPRAVATRRRSRRPGRERVGVGNCQGRVLATLPSTASEE